MTNAKSPRVRLGHILAEIDDVLAATAGHTAQQIIDSYTLRRVTERALQIISEAAKETPEAVRALEPDIPWTNIIGIGNRLRHEYYRINAANLTEILSVQLPALRPAVVRLLAQMPQ